MLLLRTSLVSLCVACALFATSAARGAYVYRVDANAYQGPAQLFEYDTVTNTWATKATLPGTGNYTSLAVDNGVLYALPNDNNIYRYDRAANAWAFVRSGPAPAATGSVGLFEAHGGRFFYGRDGTNTLSFTTGATWTNVAAPQALSSGSDVDEATGRIYVRTYAQTGGMVFDPATNAFTSTFTNTTSINENARAGVYFNGFFYDRNFSTGELMRKVDVTTGAFTTVGGPLGTLHPGMDVDPAGNVYMNSYGTGGTFEVFNVVTGTLTPLASAPGLTGNPHPALAYVAIPEPGSIATVVVAALCAAARRRRTSAA